MLALANLRSAARSRNGIVVEEGEFEEESIEIEIDAAVALEQELAGASGS